MHLTLGFNLSCASAESRACVGSLGNAARPFLRFALAVFIASFAGCATTPTVSNLAVRIVDAQGEALASDALVLPGSTASVAEVFAIGENGEQTLLQPGVDFGVEVRGGSWNPVGNQLLFAAEPEQIPEGGYLVTLVHAKGFSLTRRFLPDFARLHGPAPDALQSFSVSLVWQEEGKDQEVPTGTPLVPGQEYRATVVAVDSLGRQFSVTDSKYPIPLNRVQISTVGLRRTSADPLRFVADYRGGGGG